MFDSYIQSFGFAPKNNLPSDNSSGFLMAYQRERK